MTTQDIDKINRERLEVWRAGLTQAHATPAILIGVGHDHEAGQVHLCIPENLPLEFVIAQLQSTILALGAKL